VTMTSALASRRVGELAATLPGATMVFRRFRLDFCCHLEATLVEVARDHDIGLDRIEAALAALPVAVRDPAPSALEPLIGHILSRYHLHHRRKLPELIALAGTVERHHPDHPDVPYGLAAVLREMTEALEAHMRHEETELFPRLFGGGGDAQPTIAALRDEHDGLVAYLCCIETVTAGHIPPADACHRWRSLYEGTSALVDDLLRHRYLENEGLPRCLEQEAGAWLH